MKKVTILIVVPVLIIANLGCSALGLNKESKSVVVEKAPGMRTPSNVEHRIGGRSIPENSRQQNTVIEKASASFAIRENGIKITQMVTSTYSDRTGGKYGMEIDGVIIDGLISAEGHYIQNDKSNNDRMVAPSESSKIKVIKDWSNTGEFYSWWSETLAGRYNRKSVSIVMHNDAGEEIRIIFYGCYPTKWKGPELNARNSAHATESLEISFESYEIKS